MSNKKYPTMGLFRMEYLHTLYFFTPGPLKDHKKRIGGIG